MVVLAAKLAAGKWRSELLLADRMLTGAESRMSVVGTRIWVIGKCPLEVSAEQTNQ